jgi:propanol-preferring alcohol dehydrogenase
MMKAMELRKLGNLADVPEPLQLVELPEPVPGEGQVLLKVSACGVCHTELDEIEGRTPPPQLPVILGHQVIGRVEGWGHGANRFQVGDRVGVGWIFSSCGKCSYCRSGQENLCPDFQATGRDANGGYAGYMVVPEGFAYPIPDYLSDVEAAPLLCAGAIGYRSLSLTGLKNGQILGLTGFGASGHLVLKMARARFPDSPVYVFARDPAEREFSRQLGAAWAGEIAAEPPDKLDCIIDTTPVWLPVLEALRCLKPGGRLVVNAIRKQDSDQEELLNLSYPDHLWMEKELKSVANVTRQDVTRFLELATDMGLKPEVEEYPLEQANQALVDLQTKRVRGGKVLVMG